jgi:RNA polymerase sigma-70 factor (ECF subfamily)
LSSASTAERPTAPARAASGPERDAARLGRLLDGDEAEFAEVVRAWSPLMLNIATSYVHTRATAEECVQDAWLTFIRCLPRFEGRSQLRTWAIGIVINIARRRGRRDARAVMEPAVQAERFDPSGDWTTVGAPRALEPERALFAREALAVIEGGLAELPPRQRSVVMLRDVHGLSAGEVCEALALTPANQRVLLHRGRALVRRRLEEYLR